MPKCVISKNCRTKIKNDVNFHRMGALAGFLGRQCGLGYIDSQINLDKVWYTNPSDLFLNGVIDTKRGTCGSLASLHAAIARRLGWPVSICSAASHWMSRYDDGKTTHTIETSKIGCEGFSANPDQWYMEEYQLPKKAVLCGSDLRKLTAREMLGSFLAMRGRHHTDSRKDQLADLDYSLARHLFPSHRKTHMRACATMVKLSVNLFNSDEVGHMKSFFEELAPTLKPAPRNEVYTSRGPEMGTNLDNPFVGQLAQTVVTAGCFSPKKIEA